MSLFPLIWFVVSIGAIVLLIIFQPSRHITWLVIIALLVSFAVWVSLPNNPGIKVDLNGDGVPEINKPIAIREGLDLAGGLQVLLEADLPEGQSPPAGAMDEVRRIIEDRIDALGALEPVVQLRGDRRIIVELPGYQDPERATDLIRQTALLEFVELPGQIPAGTHIRTDYVRGQTGRCGQAATGTGTPGTEAAQTETPTPTETPTVTPTLEPTASPQTTGTPSATPEVTATPEPEGPVYHTVMTGEALQTADVVIQRTNGQPVVSFTLQPDCAQFFGDYTGSHIGGYLGIVLDGAVVSAPVIRSAIPSGQGVIEGQYTVDTASQLATQLRYGALPIALKIESTNTIGPTLGQISVEKSIRAGVIGIAVVLIFMFVYYRVPGVSASLALLVFAILNFAIYKLLPEYFTMTLPAITGFLISVGTAVDGNILIFERMKEELRAGKRLSIAIEAGFERAWTSIRDSNLSTIIICAILWFFGSSFGAGAVRGFAVTLALGLVINLFTAVTVTRTFLHFILMPLQEEALTSRRWLLGL